MCKEMKWVLTDLSKRVYVEECSIGPSSVEGCSGKGSWSVVKSRLKGGISDGVDIVEINNGRFSFTIVPTRGMELWRGFCDGCRVGWDSPSRYPVNPMFIDFMEKGGLGWLKGFNGCMVRCGLNSNGGPGTDVVVDAEGNRSESQVTLHGTIDNMPASYVEVRVVPGETDEIIVTGIVEDARIFSSQYRLVSTFSTFAGSNRVSVHDEIVNIGDSPAELMLLYHCNFGAPFLEDGSRIVCPAREVAPKDAFAASGAGEWDVYGAPQPGYSEQCFFMEMNGAEDGSSLSMLRNKAGDKGVVVRFNVKQLPCFCQWKRPGGLGEGYVTGMEPALNFPNFKTFERDNGRVGILAPGANFRTDLALEVHVGAENVAAVEREVGAIMGGRGVKLHNTPYGKWS